MSGQLIQIMSSFALTETWLEGSKTEHRELKLISDLQYHLDININSFQCLFTLL